MLFRSRTIRKVPPIGPNDSAAENRKFAEGLNAGEPIAPRHAEIDLPELDSGVAKFGNLSGVFWAYEYFENYANYIHRFSDPDMPYDIGPWRLERQSNPSLILSTYDGPNFGIRYEVYYNSVVLGSLELDPMSSDYNEDKDLVSCILNIEISPAPFIPAPHLYNLLSVCSEPFGGRDRLISINQSMQQVLWEVNRIGSQWVSLDFGYSGDRSLSRPIRSR